MVKKHGHWIIKSSECLHKDEFVEFWVDEVENTDGKPSRYATTRMKPGVSVVALDDEGAVYLTKQFRYAIGRESVEAVAGAIEEGEEAEEAARRELREELGIEAGEFIDLGTVDAVTSQVFSPSRIFLARRLKFTQTDRESTEHIESLKVEMEEAVRMALEGVITQATTIVLILKAERFFARETAGV